MSLTLTKDETRAQAKRALVEFNKLISSVYQPLLRAVTGKRSLQVKPTADLSATDGKTVYLMVPWVLGETREHDRSLCNKRDPDEFFMLCEACRVRDEIDATVFHESAHITSESFEEVDPNRVEQMVKDHLPFIELTKPLPWHYKGRRVWMQCLAAEIEPVYLPIVTNAVEDIYVNRRLFEARAGVELSLQAKSAKVFKRGFYQADGTHIDWAKQPIDMQAVMAAYLVGHRLPHLIKFLDPRVHDLADDQVIIGLMEGVPVKGDAYARGEIAFKLLAHLRSLGFAIPPSKREPEPEPDPQGDDSDEKDEPKGDDGDDEEPQSGPKGNGSTKGEEAGDDESEDSEMKGDSQDESDESDKDEVDELPHMSRGGDQEEDPSPQSDPQEAGGDDDEDESDDPEGDGSDEAGDEPDEDADDADEDDQAGKGEQGDSEDDEDGDEPEDGDEEFPAGQGGDEADDDDEESSMDEEDGKQDEGPTPEELDQQAAEEVAKAMRQFMGHEEQEQEDGNYTDPEEGLNPHPEDADAKAQEALDEAIRWQKFDTPPSGIKDFYESEPDLKSYEARYYERPDLDPGLVSGETARLRSVFALNRKTRLTGSLKSGSRLDVPNLHRIGQDDFRIFAKKDRPARRDWFVLVGLDDSGSTHSNGAAEVIREMGLGIGEMLNGVGVKFAIYGHGGTAPSMTPVTSSGWSVRHLVVKGPDEPWTDECKDRLKFLGRDNTCNYDGHSLEQYRKVLDKRSETDKMLLYVTDGAMPMMNFNEELEVLKREIGYLQQRKVNLFGVGYRTDSPKQHGMDTLVIQDGRDLPGLIDGLRSRLES